ncbi:MAG: DUF4474 domain-containing protein [Oligoflexia bacterium]|nr:DUF4474 domain-containing protein [Oligoflexia bacterium]
MKHFNIFFKFSSFTCLFLILFFTFTVLNSPLSKANDFAKIADTAGFIYDTDQDIYVTKIYPLQRLFGYNQLFDKMALTVGMIIDSEPVIFNYNGKTYMIELWKGQYSVMTGSEIGFYEQLGPTWKCVEDKDMLNISYSLVKNGLKIFERKGKHWWLTGFKPGVFANPEELTLENIFIEFKDAGMRDAFLHGLYNLGYDDFYDKIKIDSDFNTKTHSVNFRFSNTKTPQPWSLFTRNFVQMSNRELVRKFNLIKASLNRTDNSPETMDIILNKLSLQNILF